MSLSLDLGVSIAKIARAREHLKTLKGEISAVLAQRSPYTIRASEIDPDSGRCSAFLVPSEFEKELRLGVLVGDVIHNLRSSLDHIVSQLVHASGIGPTTRHQFPIFRTEIGYRSRVGEREIAKPDGPLGGIKYGLTDIWDIQPFNCQKDPQLTSLFLIHEFSNGDKHRILAGYMPLITSAIELRLETPGNLIELERIPFSHAWEPGKEYEIARLRFAPPYPSKMDAIIAVEVNFATEPLDKAIGGIIGISQLDLEAMCERVLRVTELFESL